MIHELIDPKKKANKVSAQKNTKTILDSNALLGECNNEGIEIDNKEAESSSTTFIPPWLRNSLGLNQRTNLSNLDWNVCLPNFTALGQAALGSDPKSTKISQRVKEPNHNDSESLKGQNEHGSNVLPEDRSQDVNFFKSEDNADNADAKSDKTIPVYWKEKQKELEINDTNAEGNSNHEPSSRMIENEDLFCLDAGKAKDENKTMQKNLKQRNKLKKRMTCERTLGKEDLDFLLEMKAKEAIDNCLKKDAGSELQNLEAKLLLLSSKIQDVKFTKISEQELAILQEIKNRLGSTAEFENLLEQVRKLSFREAQKSSDPPKVEEKKEEKTSEKHKDDVKLIDDKESVLSTDDENDIKRFSEFLNKNKNLEEKRKCLEEVRNYFEKKRKSRLAKRRNAEDGKAKTSEGPEVLPEKTKHRETFRGRKSKFALCSDEVVEKAVDETLQKFIDLYHISVSPSVVGSMKKNILQAITTEPDETFFSKSADAPQGSKKILNFLNMNEKRGVELPFVLNKEFVSKESKKKNFKTLLETPDELGSTFVKETDVMENEKLKRLKKEFDGFLYSIQGRIDVTNLKLQSIVLEKEEPAVSSKNVQFVYNFTKKSLEPEKEGHGHGWRGTSECKVQHNVEVQVSLEKELVKRNVKIQATERKPSCERSLQTEDKVSVSQYSQTTDFGLSFKEITELKSSDVTSGLYRMVKSNEPGKFYLYPEKEEEKEQENPDVDSNSFTKEIKSKKKDQVKALDREKTKERRFFLREKGRAKLKRSKKTISKPTPIKNGISKKEKSESSVNCLYFRNFEEKDTNSKKEFELTDENQNERTEEEEDLALEGTVEMPREPHLGCCWFWNGEKISPGSDLKTHVESLLKEKLKEMTKSESQENEGNETFKEDSNGEKPIEGNLEFRFSKTENTVEAVENEKPKQNEEPVVLSEEKFLKNVGTQNSEKTILSLNLSKMKVDSVGRMSDRKKLRRRNIVIRPVGKSMNLKKAENIIKAVEELKKIRLDLEKTKGEDDSPDSESALEDYASTSGFKPENEDPLSVVLGLPEHERTSQTDFKNKLKKLMSFVDRDIHTTDAYDVDEANSSETPPTDLSFFKTVLSRAKQKERENLWNDLRDFIKSKIGRDINDEGAQEVCIEIEQNLPRSEQGKGEKQPMAKGHYARDNDDVEVEIDLTLEDLGKILRQRNKKSRRRVLYRPRSKKGLSSSSLQSDLTRENLRRYQKYLHRFAALGSDFVQDKAYLEK